MIKILGLSLVFLAFTGTGAGMAKGLENELHTAKELLLLIRKIGTEVRCYKRPLPEILANFESEHLDDFVKTLGETGFSNAFSQLSADPAVYKICCPFFDGVGRCSAEECNRLETECAASLSQWIEETGESVMQKMKVYRSLGLAGAMIAVILLL